MNILKIIAVVAVIVCVAVAIIYVMGQFEVTKPYYDQIVTATDNIKTTVTDNWQTIATGGGIATAAGTVLGAASKINSIKEKLSNTITTTNTQINELQSGTENLKGIIKQKNVQLSEATSVKTNLETQLNTAQSTITSQAEEIQRKIIANEELQKLEVANFTNLLPTDSIVTNANGNTIKTVTKTIVK